MEEKHTHSGPGASAGIAVPGAGTTVLAAANLTAGNGTVVFQVQIAGDWVSLSAVRRPQHRVQSDIPEVEPDRYAVTFNSGQGTFNYRWECVEHIEGDLVTYILA